jgi:hypothetical protein
MTTTNNITGLGFKRQSARTRPDGGDAVAAAIAAALPVVETTPVAPVPSLSTAESAAMDQLLAKAASTQTPPALSDDITTHAGAAAPTGGSTASETDAIVATDAATASAGVDVVEDDELTGADVEETERPRVKPVSRSSRKITPSARKTLREVKTGSEYEIVDGKKVLSYTYPPRELIGKANGQIGAFMLLMFIEDRNDANAHCAMLGVSSQTFWFNKLRQIWKEEGIGDGWLRDTPARRDLIDPRVTKKQKALRALAHPDLPFPEAEAAA